MKRKSIKSLSRIALAPFKNRRFAAWLAPQSRSTRRRRATRPEWDYPLPTIEPAAIARDIVDRPGGTAPDNLLKYDAYAAGFSISLGSPDDVLEFVAGNESITLNIRGSDYQETIDLEVDGGGNVTPTELVFDVGPDFMAAIGGNPLDYTTLQAWYRVTFVGGSRDDSGDLPLSIDTRKPAYDSVAGDLIISSEIRENGISLSTFGGADFIEFGVPSYAGIKAGDWIRLVVDGVTDNEEDRKTVVPYLHDGVQLKLRVYRAFLETVGDGSLDFAYVIIPREENRSDISHAVTLVVRISDGIDGLAEPAVPKYDNDPPGSQLIDEADARTPVDVVIPSRPEITDVDSIRILLGDNVRTDPVRVEDASNIVVYVAYAGAWLAWLEQNPDGEDRAVPVDVRYEVYGEEGNLRGISEPHPIEINLHTAGGIVDPDPGTEPNENLEPLRVVADSGTENRITIPDLGKDATAFVPKLSLADDGSGNYLPAFGVGDVITIRAEGIDTALATHPVVLADLTPPDDDLAIMLRWAELKDVPAGTTDFACWIDTTLGSGDINTNKSMPQEVIIDSADALPGKGDLPDVILPEITTGVTIPQFHITNGVVVGLPAEIDNFDPETDTITVSIPMYAAGHKAGEAPVDGFGDVVGENRFVLPPPHTVHPADSGPVTEPPGGGSGGDTRPAITVPYVLFRLERSRFPTIGDGPFYHSHITWKITNSVGDGVSPAIGKFVTFETRGSSRSALEWVDAPSALLDYAPRDRHSLHDELLALIERLSRQFHTHGERARRIGRSGRQRTK